MCLSFCGNEVGEVWLVSGSMISVFSKGVLGGEWKLPIAGVHILLRLKGLIMSRAISFVCVVSIFKTSELL